MKRIYLIVLLTGACIWLMAACSKKYTKPNEVDPGVNVIQAGVGDVPTGSALDKLFKELKSTPERQCVTVGETQTITFAKGTMLKFYPNSFKDKNGNVITSGTVCLDVIEMYKPGDMIANRASTMSEEGILKSGGQVNIKAWKNGEEVFAKAYDISFASHSFIEDTMYLYEGNNTSSDSIVRWKRFDNFPAAKRDSILGTVGSSLYSFYNCTKFVFINCDRLFNYTGPRTVVKVTMPDNSYDHRNTVVFIVLHELNCAVPFFQESNIPRFMVGDEPAHEIPTELKATIITVTKKNDIYYYYEKSNLTVSEGLSVDAIPIPRSLDFIKTKLSEL